MPVVGFATNPMFGNAENQIGVYAGVGTGGSNIYHLIPGTWWDFKPFSIFVIQYSQPMKFFRLPARYSFHAVKFHGFGKHDGENWRAYSQVALGMSTDAVFFHTRRFYFGAGLGAFEKSKVDTRQDSRFVFQLKLFAGCKLSDRWSAELFTQHFSNGNLTPTNASYNFVGLAALVNF
jgi:hypothetical protein